MKINLEEKLNQEKKKDNQPLDTVKEVKLLLAGDESEDLRILRNLSENSEINRIEKVTQNKLELENLESSYDGNVFTYEQIKKLAIDYHLRFLSARQFIGNFDVEVASKIKEFSKRTNTSIDDHSLKTKFFILGPEEVFTLENVKFVEPKKQIDPVLFYKIDNDHYRLIHKWGNDFTILRYLEGHKWKSFWNYFFFSLAKCLPIFAFIMGCISELSWVTLSFWSIIGCSLGAIVMTLIFVHLRFTRTKTDGDSNIIKGYFTPDNWNSTQKTIR
jgi:hypothetical protein